MVTVPLTLYWFGQWTLLGVVANVFAVPLVAFVATPCVLLAVLLGFLPVVADWLWWVADVTLGLTWWGLQHLLLGSRQIFPTDVVLRSDLLACSASLLGMIGLLLPWPWQGKLPALILASAVLWPQAPRPPGFYFLDNGYHPLVAWYTEQDGWGIWAPDRVWQYLDPIDLPHKLGLTGRLVAPEIITAAPEPCQARGQADNWRWRQLRNRSLDGSRRNARH